MMASPYSNPMDVDMDIDVDESFSRDLMVMGEEEMPGPDRVRKGLEQKLQGLSGPQQLTRLTEILALADSMEEQRVTLVHEAWELVRSKQLWIHHPGGNEAALKDALQFEECIAPALARHQIFLQRKQNYAREIERQWGVSSPESLLLPPPSSSQLRALPDAILSRNTLGELARFSRLCTEVDEAKRLLADAVKLRQSTAGRRKQDTLLPADVREARRRLKTTSASSGLTTTPTAPTNVITTTDPLSQPRPSGLGNLMKVVVPTTQFEAVKSVDPPISPSKPLCACPPAFHPLWRQPNTMLEAFLECCWDVEAHHPRFLCQRHLRELCQRLDLSSRGSSTDLIALLERLHHQHDDDVDALYHVAPELFRRSHQAQSKSLAESRTSRRKPLRYGPKLGSSQPPKLSLPSSCLCPARFRRNLVDPILPEPLFLVLWGCLHVEISADLSGLKNLCLAHLIMMYRALKVPLQVNLIEFSQLILDQASWPEEGEEAVARWTREVEEVTAQDGEESSDEPEEEEKEEESQEEGTGDEEEEEDDDADD